MATENGPITQQLLEAVRQCRGTAREVADRTGHPVSNVCALLKILVDKGQLSRTDERPFVYFAEAPG